MTEAPPRPMHRWTFADLDLLPDDGNRYEIIDGNLIVSPAPTARHQRITHLLSWLLENAAPDSCSVIPGTGVLRECPGSTRYLIPDVLVVQASAITDAALNLDPADVVLVVEVVSPSSMTHDRITKREVYARLGIPHYWLVESDRPGAIIALTLDESGVYVPVAEVVGEDELVLDQPFPVRIIPAALRR